MADPIVAFPIVDPQEDVNQLNQVYLRCGSSLYFHYDLRIPLEILEIVPLPCSNLHCYEGVLHTKQRDLSMVDVN